MPTCTFSHTRIKSNPARSYALTHPVLLTADSQLKINHRHTCCLMQMLPSICTGDTCTNLTPLVTQTHLQARLDQQVHRYTYTQTRTHAQKYGHGHHISFRQSSSSLEAVWHILLNEKEKNLFIFTITITTYLLILNSSVVLALMFNIF